MAALPNVLEVEGENGWETDEGPESMPREEIRTVDEPARHY